MDIKRIKGIIPPIITPINDDEKLNEGALRALVNHCIDSGLHGIFVAGSGGETVTMTQKERNRTIKAAIDQADDRVPVLCGVMDTGTKKVIENIKELEQLGGEIAVVTPAFYTRYTCQNEVIRHFEQIAKSTDIKIVMYNIPIFTQVNIEPETVSKLSKIDNIIGLKDTGPSFVKFEKCLHSFADTDFRILQGVTNVAGVSMLIGADGAIPVLAPLFPELFIKLYEAAKARDVSSVMKLSEIVFKSSNILSSATNATSAAKYAISLLGLTEEKVMAPCEPVAAEEAMKIRSIAEEIKELSTATISVSA